MTRSVEYSELSPWLWGIAIFVALVLVAIVAGCGTTPAAMPEVEFSSATITGQLELTDGTVIDLATGVTVAGESGVTAKRLDLDVAAVVLVDKRPQGVTLESRNHRVGEWIRCLAGGLDVAGWHARGRWALHPSCGDSGLTELVYRPFPEPEPAEPVTIHD
jgi:hypothetical protein